MIILGINDCSHDAAVTVLNDSEIVFASHAERYSGIKNDFYINNDIIYEALGEQIPDVICYYEKRSIKKLRNFLYGGINGKYKNLYKDIVKQSNKNIEIQFSHHQSHAAAGYYTSPFDDAAIVVVDAIGEFETSSIWIGEKESLKKQYSLSYPTSFGLFYSAYTKFLGLKPGTEEYILMGMAAYGNGEKYLNYINESFPSFDYQKCNFHYGINNFPFQIKSDQDKFNLASAVQNVFEDRLADFMKFAKRITGKSNLVYMGGCALNCTANTMLREIWDDVWIMPNPGDAGSSLGAAALFRSEHLNWKGPYLGHYISGEYPVDKILNNLKKYSIAAVASGRAEFGPRSLGNRSILADPRHKDIRDKVNILKGRENFRPFAPVVLEESAKDWFDMSYASPYMQYAIPCVYPDKIPAVVHFDKTSRVQTVNEHQHPGLYNLLKEWEKFSGVPVLLNTSLNIKNQPLINNLNDINNWNKINPNVKIV